MRVGINSYFLDKPMTGSGQYLLGLLGELGNVDPTTEFLLLGSSGQVQSLSGKTSAEALQTGTASQVGNGRKAYWEHITIPNMCKREHVELLHVPYFGSPFLPSCKTVVTIHDLIMTVLPQHHGSLLVRAYTYAAGLAAKRARIIIADSECTKRDIVRLLNIDPRKIRVIYLACDERFKPVEDEYAQRKVRQKYGLEGRFVLYVGGLDWRKNVSTLIHAFSMVREDATLAIAGKAHSDNSQLFPDLEKMAVEAGTSGKIRFLGLVDEDDKAMLYSTADLFVFPSLYEGFGLTPLEAMACGTPVICSNVSSLPEVVGEAGLLFDPNDKKQLADMIDKALSDESLAQDLRKKGLERAKQFSWRKAAEETVRVYNETIES